MQVPRRSYYAKELKLIVSRSYGPGRYDPGYEEAGLDYPIGYVRWTEGRNLQAFVDLMASGRVDVSALISHRYAIEKATQAYELIQGTKPFLGVLITYRQASARKAEKKIAVSARPVAKGRIGLGVLGAGNFARNTLLPALKGMGELEFVGIASASGRPAADLARRYRFRYAASDEAQVLADRNVDAVAVLTRHNLHASQTLAALKAGKHVFCEKPLALNEKELSSIERALAKKGASLLTVGYNRRYAPLSKPLTEFLRGRSQPLAANFRVNAGALPAYHWLNDPARGGGRLVGEGCHFIDYLIFLVGAAPVAVSAAALAAEPGAPQDSVQVTLRFGDGSIGTLAYLSNGDRSLGKERLEVFCGGKVAVLDDFRTLELTEDGSTTAHSSRQDKGHKAIWRAFVAAMRKGGEPPIAYAQIFSGARATFAAIRALETGAEVEL
jgi:predicted dehydrogenase